MKRLLEPNTALHTVPVVLLTCSGGRPNVFALNRISSCNAEPPMLAISVRPMRYSGVVRERPIPHVKVAELHERVRSLKSK